MKPYSPWLISFVIYALFFSWYTNLSGPLTEEEIEAYLQYLRSDERPAEQIERLKAFMRTDTGDDFVMINVLDMNESPPNLPATGPDAEASDLMNHYMEHMYRELFARASHPVFFGPAVADAMDLQGIEAASHWEQAALVRYRSRRDILEIALDPRFSERHNYKVGALTKTIAYPVEPTLNPGDPRFLLALILIAASAITQLIVPRKVS